MTSLSYAALIGLAIFYAGIVALGLRPEVDRGLGVLTQSVRYSLTHIPYLVALACLQRLSASGGVRLLVVVAALCFRILAFWSSPVLSDDLNRYRWEARILDGGQNPYRITPLQLPLGERDVPVPEASAVYGPVLEAANWLGWKLTGNVKVSGALAELIFLALAYWWLQKTGVPFWRWTMLAWSPLLVYEFWGQGHNDSWLLLLLFGAAVLHEDRRPIWSWCFLAGAVMTKWWPLLLVPFWLLRGAWWPGAAMLPLLLLPCLLLVPMSEVWMKLRFTTGFLGGWQNNAIGYRFLTDKLQAIGLLAAAALALPFTRLPWMESIVCLVSGMLFFSANIQPWYLSWFLPFLAASRWNPLPWLLIGALLPLAYDAQIGWRVAGLWREDPWLRNVIPLAVGGFSVFCMLWRRNR